MKTPAAIDPPNVAIQTAAALIRDAVALVIAAGAGLGVDSGLPDFRGNEGFWNAYPPFRHLGLNFTDLANPVWFRDDPPLAWGFYGHRLNLTAAPNRTPASRSCVNGRRRSRAGRLYLPRMWTASFSARDFVTITSWSVTAPYIDCKI